MVKQLIKEAMDKNPIGLKEALSEELRSRVALAMEAKIDKEDKLDESREKVKTITQKEFNEALTNTTTLSPKAMLDIYDHLPKGKKDFTFRDIQNAIIKGYPFKNKAKLDLAYKVKKYWNMEAVA